MLRLPEQSRRDPESLRGILLSAPGEERVPLGQVAEVSLKQGPELITRESGQRRIVVQTNVRGRDLGGFVADARPKVERAVPLPPGYSMQWGGQFEKSGAGDATARDRAAGVYSVDLWTAVCNIPIRAAIVSDFAECPVRVSGRNRGVVGARAESELVGVRGLHCALRRRGAQRDRYGEGYINSLRERGCHCARRYWRVRRCAYARY